MKSKPTSHRYTGAIWFVVVALVLSLSSSVLVAQDGDEELTLEELQEQRELAAQQLADAAASIDTNTATIEELGTALDEIASLASIHQLRLDEAIENYDSALGRLDQAEQAQEEVLAEIDILRVLVSDLALAQFTGESGREPFELALSTDPGESARLTHLLELQTGSAEDAMDRLRVLEFQAQELVAERDSASALAEESLVEMEHRASELDAAFGQQERLIEAAELRLATSESDAEAAALLIEETDERLLEWVRAIGLPAPVDRDDIVTISFHDGSEIVPFFQIQVHKDIEEQTRSLYQLAFSQGINLGGWGFRSTERQIELRRAHCGDSNFDIWLKPAGQCNPPTARPGFSKHEQGRAIDFQWNGGSIGPRSGTPFRWLAANAPQFGFVNLPSEPWHWSDGTDTVFDPTVPVPVFTEDDFPEVEPVGDVVDLLNEPLEGEEVDAEADEAGTDPVGDESDETELDGTEAETTEAGEAASTEAPPPEALPSVDEEAGASEPAANQEAPIDEPEANSESSAERAAEPEVPAEPVESPEPAADG